MVVFFSRFRSVAPRKYMINADISDTYDGVISSLDWQIWFEIDKLYQADEIHLASRSIISPF